MTDLRILVVRLGAMGDVIHALPAVATLRESLAHARISWIVDPKWTPLLEDNPFVDEVIPFNRKSWNSVRNAWRGLRARQWDLAVDFQGLIKSAIIATAAAPERIFGFDPGHVRERAACLFYSHHVKPVSAHVVDQNLELAASAGGTVQVHAFALPTGRPEGELPVEPFVLASPFAGWASKQWPIEYYRELARSVPLVVNGPPGAAAELRKVEGARVHLSGIEGLIDATRRAAAVVGVDSGPMHLAAALRKPGVAVFGPTDPARNGPYGSVMTVLRDPSAVTTYKRDSEISPSMRAIRPAAVTEALQSAMTRCKA